MAWFPRENCAPGIGVGDRRMAPGAHTGPGSMPVPQPRWRNSLSMGKRAASSGRPCLGRGGLCLPWAVLQISPQTIKQGQRAQIIYK